MWDCVEKYYGEWITHGWLASFLRYSARMPLRILLFMLFISVAFIFSMDSDEGI